MGQITEKLVDEQANQKRIEAIKQDKASDPENPPLLIATYGNDARTEN